ncbi:uncharacterized protein PADG_11431 [Paracoccidioides brasiliensis Pb18]|uniref:Uncharacterized protein n=1 Tax=Paracoccidioides brasiliensis (strain Pb18) TaxID=502780 RepID=A0A0A0HUJ4_PARBD|nr:uncharacterized protein PADG_11431 [Paracoccidioides brasiliensis Pb18]KGM92247.1 hypothetical protein PADG_11431 [Paracoccidioides brasiliensis Pb18]
MHVDQRKEGGKSKSKEVGLGVSIDDYGGRSIGSIFPRAVKKSAPENKVSNYFTVIQISYEDLPLSEDGGHCRRSLDGLWSAVCDRGAEEQKGEVRTAATEYLQANLRMFQQAPVTSIISSTL